MAEARREARRQWDSVKKQLHAPAKMHRLERYGVAQLPYHPQYMDAGASFNADLRQPLEFGTEPLRPETLSAIGAPPPAGSVVHALLVTPLNSASTKKGALVEAVISQPLVVSERLFLPQGSQLKVRSWKPGPRELGRNGSCKWYFTRWFLPAGSSSR